MAHPTRMCQVCRRRAPKPDLVRWVKSAEGYIKDESGRQSGRGYYTDSAECEAKLINGKRK